MTSSEASSTASSLSPPPEDPAGEHPRSAEEDEIGRVGGEVEVTAQMPPPKVTVAGVGLTAAGWLLYAVLYALLLTRAEGVPFAGAIAGQVMEAIVLGLASLPVWWGTVRRMDAVSGLYTGLVHAAVAPVFAWGTLEIYLALVRVAAGPAVAEELSARYAWIFATHLTLYVIEFSAFHLVRSMKRLRWRERQAAEYASLARERELDALKAQINPHFLFNTFNSVSATVHTAPEEAREMLADLADLFRYVLDSTGDDAVPLRDELDFARAYLGLEAHRFHDRLDVRYQIEVPDDALNVRVPPMILQPLVENAIQHGISQREEGGTVTVAVTRPHDDESGATSNALRVEVVDTGAGSKGDDAPVRSGPGRKSPEPDDRARTAGDTRGVGLTNTNKRLTHAFGPAARIHTETLSPHGFRVWFHVPE